MWNCMHRHDDGHYDSEEKRQTDIKLWKLIRYYEAKGIAKNIYERPTPDHIYINLIQRPSGTSFDDLFKGMDII